MHKTYLKLAAIIGALSVALGAFGAHALKEKLPVDALAVYETAIRYQFYHVFALLTVGVLYKGFPNKWINNAGKLFITGIILFCGSLYLLTALKGMGKENLNWIGAITPFGGLSFILGWVSLVIGISKN
ncbi:MAG: DUF423 domain-containing protein [Sphingobacteriales bacterium]|nr:DUF423 domain-containing protein [Sphingobacteriales bacterium]MBI3720244.1 DUF423 domain-containing protein [Sphingobacteriales bacterium]